MAAGGRWPVAGLEGPDDVERVRYQSPNDERAAALLQSAMTNYGERAAALHLVRELRFLYPAGA